MNDEFEALFWEYVGFKVTVFSKSIDNPAQSIILAGVRLQIISRCAHTASPLRHPSCQLSTQIPSPAKRTKTKSRPHAVPVACTSPFRA